MPPKPGASGPTSSSAADQKSLGDAAGSAKSSVDATKDLNKKIAKSRAQTRSKRVRVVAIAKGFDGFRMREPGDRFVTAIAAPEDVTEVPAASRAAIRRAIVLAAKANGTEPDASDKIILERYRAKVCTLPSWMLTEEEYDRRQADEQQAADDAELEDPFAVPS